MFSGIRFHHGLSFLILSIVSEWSVCTKYAPVVVTKYGKVRGLMVDSDRGNEGASLYLGIPFSQPPVGELRYERPKQPEKWEGIKDVQEFPPSCPPHHRSDIIPPMSEDCLYLSVLTPMQADDYVEKYPVMVWIHGGGFGIGSASMLGYESFVHSFVSKSIVVVLIQYRLGPFGFFTDGSTDIASNLGYWDMTLALQFVHENIAAFGGDPNQITVAGHSAGGAAVGGLCVSPHSRDLFQQAIQMSGSPMSLWATSDSSVKGSLEIAEYLNCSTQDSKKLKICMKTKSIYDIMDAVNATGSAPYSADVIKFSPRVDGDFFPRKLDDLIKESPKKPTLMGLAQKESAFFVIQGNCETLVAHIISPAKFDHFAESDIIKVIDEVFAPEEFFGDETKNAREDLYKHFVWRKHPDSNNTRFYLEMYTEIFSDVVFNVPIIREGMLKMENNWPVWFYLIDHFNLAAFRPDDPVKGSTHTSEFFYLFNNFTDESAMVDDEARMQKTMVNSLINFIKTGNPSTNSFKWFPISREHPMRNFRFRPDSLMAESFFDENVEFWKSMEKYHYDIIDGKRKETRPKLDEL